MKNGFSAGTSQSFSGHADFSPEPDLADAQPGAAAQWPIGVTTGSVAQQVAAIQAVHGIAAGACGSADARARAMADAPTSVTMECEDNLSRAVSSTGSTGNTGTLASPPRSRAPLRFAAELRSPEQDIGPSYRHESEASGALGTSGPIPAGTRAIKPVPGAEAQRRTCNEVLDGVARFLRDRRGSVNLKADYEFHRKCLEPFIWKVLRAGNKLTGDARTRVSYPKLLKLAKDFEHHPNASAQFMRAFGTLANSLYAADLSAQIQNFRAFLDAEGRRRRHDGRVMATTTLRDQRYAYVNSILKLNMHLLSQDRPGLLPSIQAMRALDSTEREAHLKAMADDIKAAGASLNAIVAFFNFIDKGAETCPAVEAPPALAALVRDASPPVSSQLSRVTAVGDWPRRKLEIESRMFLQIDGQRRTRFLQYTKSCVQLQAQPERIDLRCLGGAGELHALYYHEVQHNMNCGSHAFNSYMLRTYDLAYPPLILGKTADPAAPAEGGFLYAEQRAWHRWESETGRQRHAASAEERELLLEALLDELHASRRPWSFELFQHLTGGGLDSGSEVAQLLRALKLVKLDAINIPLGGGKGLARSRDWTFLTQIINQVGGSGDRYLMFHHAKGSQLGHYYAFHRDPVRRNWRKIDSLDRTQPEIPPGRMLRSALLQDLPSLEILYTPSALPSELAATRQIDQALLFYKETLGHPSFDDATAALRALTRVDVGAVVLHQFLNNGRDVVVLPPGREPVLDFEQTDHVRNISVADLVGFVNHAMRDEGQIGAMDHATLEWAQPALNLPDLECQAARKALLPHNLRALLMRLDELGPDAGPVLLGGWRTAPFFIVVNKDETNRWRLVDGPDGFINEPLETCFLGKPMGDPPVSALVNPSHEAPLTRVDMMYCLPAWRGRQAAQSLQQHIDSASEKCMGRLLVRLQTAETALVQANAAAMAEEEAARNSVGTPRHSVRQGTSTEIGDHDSRPASVRPGAAALALPPGFHTNSGNEAWVRAGILGGALVDLGEDRLSNATPGLGGRQAGRMVRRLEAAISADRSVSTRPKPPMVPYQRAQLDRQHRQHITSQRIARAGGLAELMLAVPLRMSDAVALRILTDFQRQAARDPRFAHLNSKEDLLVTITRAIQPEFKEFQREFSGGIVRILIGTNVMYQGQDGNLRPQGLPILLRIAHSREGGEHCAILDMQLSSQESLAAMRLVTGHRKWQTRRLSLKESVAEQVSEQIRLEPGREVLPIPQDRDRLLAAITEGLLLEGDDRPVRLRASLWRVNLQMEHGSVAVLVTLRGGRQITNVVLDTPDNRQQAMDETIVRDQRLRSVVQRIWENDELSDQSISRFNRVQNESGDDEYYSFFDTVQMLANPDACEELGGEGARHSTPLKQRVIRDDDGKLVARFYVLHEDGELIDLRPATDENRDDMLRLRLSAELEARLESIADGIANDSYNPGSTVNGADADGELGQLVKAMMSHREGVMGLESLADVVAETVVRGRGACIHADYPDLKRYQMRLLNMVGAFGNEEVLMELGGDGRVTRILRDLPANRERMLAYRIKPLDLVRILRIDGKQALDGQSHGPLVHAAKLDMLRSLPDEEGDEAASLERMAPRPLVAQFLRSCIKRGEGTVVDADFPEIAFYKTGLLDRQGNPIRLLARVRQSNIVDVRECSLKNYLNMALHKADPGDHLLQVREALGHAFSESILLEIVHPHRQSAAPREAACPAWHVYDEGGISRGVPLLANVQQREVAIVTVDSDENWNALATYRIPVEHAAHIMDSSRNFLRRHKRASDNIWQYVLDNVVRGAGTPIQDWPQLHVHRLPSAIAGHVEVVVRIENNEIWSLYENSPQHVTQLQRRIVRDLVVEGRRVSREEQRRLQKESVDYIVGTLQKRQLALGISSAQEQEQRASHERNLRRIAFRERRAEQEQLGLPDELRGSDPATLEALHDNIFDLVDGLVQSGQWENVPHYPDIRRCRVDADTDVTGAQYLYAYFDGTYLVDAYLGSEGSLATLVWRRREMMQQIPELRGSRLSHQEIQQVYMRDHMLRQGELIELADSDLVTLVQFLNQVAPLPERRNGQLRFKNGTPVQTATGNSHELFRRCATGRRYRGREADVFVLYKTDKPWGDPSADIRLQDVWIVPPPRTRDEFELSSSLRTQIQFAQWNHPPLIDWPALTRPVAAEQSLPFHPAIIMPATPRSVAGTGYHPQRHDDDESPRSAAGLIQTSGKGTGSSDVNMDANLQAGKNTSMDPEQDLDLDVFQDLDMNLDVDLDVFHNLLVEGAADNSFLHSAVPNPDDLSGFNVGLYHEPILENHPSDHVDPHVGSRLQGLDQLGVFDPVNAMLQQPMPWNPYNLASQGTVLQQPMIEADSALDLHMMGLQFNQDDMNESLGEAWDFEHLMHATSMQAGQLPATAGASNGGMDELAGPGSTTNNEAQANDEGDSYNPFIFRLDRIEYDDTRVNEFMRGIQSRHGKNTLDRLSFLLAPNQDVVELSRNCLHWIEMMAQPERQSALDAKYPNLKRITTSFLDDGGKPLCFLTELSEDKFSFPLVDTPLNEERLIRQATVKADSPAPSGKPASRLDADQAQQMAATLQLGDGLLDSISRQLLGDVRGIAVLEDMLSNASAKVGSKQTQQRAALREFLRQGMAVALTGKSPNTRMLTIATGVADESGAEVRLGLSLGRKGVLRCWIREASKPVKDNDEVKVMEALKREMSIGAAPRIRPEPARNRERAPARVRPSTSQARPGSVPSSAVQAAPALERSGKRVTFEAPATSAVENVFTVSQPREAMSDQQSVASDQSRKRQRSSPQGSQAKRSRIVAGIEPLAPPRASSVTSDNGLEEALLAALAEMQPQQQAASPEVTASATDTRPAFHHHAQDRETTASPPGSPMDISDAGTDASDAFIDAMLEAFEEVEAKGDADPLPDETITAAAMVDSSSDDEPLILSRPGLPRPAAAASQQPRRVSPATLPTPGETRVDREPAGESDQYESDSSPLSSLASEPSEPDMAGMVAARPYATYSASDGDTDDASLQARREIDAATAERRADVTDSESSSSSDDEPLILSRPGLPRPAAAASQQPRRVSPATLVTSGETRVDRTPAGEPDQYESDSSALSSLASEPSEPDMAGMVAARPYATYSASDDDSDDEPLAHASRRTGAASVAEAQGTVKISETNEIKPADAARAGEQAKDVEESRAVDPPIEYGLANGGLRTLYDYNVVRGNSSFLAGGKDFYFTMSDTSTLLGWRAHTLGVLTAPSQHRYLTAELARSAMAKISALDTATPSKIIRGRKRSEVSRQEQERTRDCIYLPEDFSSLVPAGVPQPTQASGAPNSGQPIRKDGVPANHPSLVQLRTLYEYNYRNARDATSFSQKDLDSMLGWPPDTISRILSPNDHRTLGKYRAENANEQIEAYKAANPPRVVIGEKRSELADLARANQTRRFLYLPLDFPGLVAYTAGPAAQRYGDDIRTVQDSSRQSLKMLVDYNLRGNPQARSKDNIFHYGNLEDLLGWPRFKIAHLSSKSSTQRLSLQLATAGNQRIESLRKLENPKVVIGKKRSDVADNGELQRTRDHIYLPENFSGLVPYTSDTGKNYQTRGVQPSVQGSQKWAASAGMDGLQDDDPSLVRIRQLLDYNVVSGVSEELALQKLSTLLGFRPNHLPSIFSPDNEKRANDAFVNRANASLRMLIEQDKAKFSVKRPQVSNKKALDSSFAEIYLPTEDFEFVASAPVSTSTGLAKTSSIPTGEKSRKTGRVARSTQRVAELTESDDDHASEFELDDGKEG